MTVPCSAPVSVPVAATASPDSPAAPGTGDATDDAFAAVLAALSGAIGAPVPPLPVQAGAEEAQTGAGAVGAAAAPGSSPVAWSAATQRQTVPGIAPAASEDLTGAPVVAEEAPVVAGHGASDIARHKGPVGAWHTTHGTEVRATTPAAQHAPFQRLATTTDVPAPTTVPSTTPSVGTTPTPSAEGDPTAPTQGDPSEPPAVPAAADATPQPVAPDATAATQVVAPTTTPTPVVAADRPHGLGPAKHVQPAVLEAARGLRHEGGGRTSLVVRLDPPELGAVLVRLTVQDGKVDVQLRTPDLVARQDLQAQQRDVQQVLRDQGFDLSSFDVTHGDVFSGNQGDSPDRGTPQRSHRADGRMDDHHPVTDDGLAPEPSGTWL